jgi:CBS domain-containing protein
MLVKDAMRKDVRTVRADSTVKEAAQIMTDNKIGGLVVVSGTGAVDGIVTERDIMIDVVAKGRDANEIKVGYIMTKRVYVIDPHASLEDAADVMTKYKIKKLPVVEEGVLVGMITASDLIRYEKTLIEKLSEIIGASPFKGVGG